MTAVATGGGTTITLGTTGASKTISARIRSVAGHTEELPEVDNNDLTTTGFSEVVGGDLIDPGSFTFVCVFDSVLANAGPTATAETVTITRGNDSSTIAGTAFIKAVKYPDYEQNEPQLGEVTIRWDGATGPTHST